MIECRAFHCPYIIIISALYIGLPVCHLYMLCSYLYLFHSAFDLIFDFVQYDETVIVPFAILSYPRIFRDSLESQFVVGILVSVFTRTRCLCFER